MTPEVVSQVAIGGVLGLLYWSLNRNIASLDTAIRGIASKVDDLHRAETQMQVKVAELSVRLGHVEAMVAATEVELQKLRGSRAE